jgi:hypothetical protein
LQRKGFPDILPVIRRYALTSSPQNRAIKRYRARLSGRGLARFEVVAPEADRTLIRTLARTLAEDGPEARRLRSAVHESMGGGQGHKGGIVAALRRSPLVGVDLDLTRSDTPGRDVDL